MPDKKTKKKPLSTKKNKAKVVFSEKKKLTTNQKQEFFCQLYATDKEFFGNGVQAYIEAYDPDRTKPNWYKTACAAASRLLSNVKVFTRINEILEETGFSEVAVDKQLSFLIAQQADFTAKLGAIREFNKLKKRITDKLDLTSKGQPIKMVSYEEVKPKNGK